MTALVAVVADLMILLAFAMGLAVKNCGVEGALMAVVLSPVLLAVALTTASTWWVAASLIASFIAGGIAPNYVRIDARFLFVAIGAATIAVFIATMLFAPGQDCGPSL